MVADFTNHVVENVKNVVRVGKQSAKRFLENMFR
jgi:hypothetical protein